MAHVNPAFVASHEEAGKQDDISVCDHKNNVHVKTVSVAVDASTHEITFDDVTSRNVTSDTAGKKVINDSDENSNRTVLPTDESVEQLGCFKKFRLLLYLRRGLLFAVLGAFCYSIEDTLMDVLAETIDVFQISCMVSALTVCFSSVPLIARKIDPPKRKLEFLLLLISGISVSLGYPTALLSLKYMDLGASISVIYTLPIFTGIFGWIILREALKLIDVFFAIVSFGGVLFIAQPAFIFGETDNDVNEDENLLLGTLYALASAISFAIVVVLSRKQTDIGLHLFVLTFCNGTVSCFINGMICTFINGWKLPTGVEWAEVIGFSVIHFGGQMSLIVALTCEAAFLVSITTTSEVIFSFIWQIIIFKIIPDWQTGVGAVLILSSCVGIALKSSKVISPETDQEKPEEGGVDAVSPSTKEEEVPAINGGKACKDTKESAGK